MISDLNGSLGSRHFLYVINERTSLHRERAHLKVPNLSVSRLFSKAIENNSISDMEFNSMLHEIKLYESLKRQLKNKAKISSKVHVDPIGEQIKEDDRKNNEVRLKENLMAFLCLFLDIKICKFNRIKLYALDRYPRHKKY